MRQLTLKKVHIPIERRTEPGEDARTGGPEHARIIRLSTICDKCKYENTHHIPLKGAYDENDLLRVAAASFNMAFFACGCVDEQKKERPTEPDVSGSSR